MILKKVIIQTNHVGADTISAILLMNGCTGTTIIDKADVKAITDDKTIITEVTKFYPKEVLVVGVIDSESPTKFLTRIEKAVDNLKQTMTTFGTLNIRTEDVNSEHWTDLWQDYTKAYTIGKLKIYGSWQKPSFSLFKIPVILNPGAAFGTGQHPTTELVISAMQKLNIKDKSILDIGCGSGILAICALKLGAKTATLVDIDDVAIDSSELNCKTNQLENRVTIVNKDLVYKKDSSIKADILLVNISSSINLDYAKNVLNNINPAGYIILSGILPEKKEIIKEAYKEKGFKLIEELEKDGWTALVMKLN